MPSSESSNLTPEGEKHKQLDRDIREMVTSITNRVANFHRSGHYKEDEDNDDGTRIITLAGTNDGATLKSEVDNNKPATGHHSEKQPEEEALSTYVNSNFQAVNNSIMFSGSYQANDPGVNVEISDFTEPTGHHKAGKHGKKGKKKKEKEGSKSDDDGDHHHSGNSD